VSLTLVSLMTLAVPVLSIAGAAVLFDEGLVVVQVAGIAVVLAVLSFAIVETSRLQKQRIPVGQTI
jgi:drug/metabolite transporter (DMT)-like permease